MSVCSYSFHLLPYREGRVRGYIVEKEHYFPLVVGQIVAGEDLAILLSVKVNG